MTDDEITRRLIASLEIAHDRFQRREASAWLVLCYDEDPPDPDDTDPFIVGAYGPFASPEEALVQVGKHDASSEYGFRNVIIPLYPPVQWKDER